MNQAIITTVKEKKMKNKTEYRKYRTFDEVIDDKTDRVGDCLIWQGGCHAQGYPMTRWEGRMVQVARHAIILQTGRELTRNHRVRNTVCGNVKCVNPDHYEIFDRGSIAWGETTAWATIEEKQALRDLWFAQPVHVQNEWGSRRRFAKKHGLNCSSLYKIIHNVFSLYQLK
jgi:hypothetical protein